MSSNSPRIEQFNIHKTFGQSFTFAELKANNISSEILLSWSASIDLTEQYQLFLNNISDPSISSENERLFYNCTSEWFGPFCRFGFLHCDINISLWQIIEDMIWYRRFEDEITCYEHLKCPRSTSLCLDWREICDGKIDCLDGSDEFDCWKMEINECLSNEYQCLNGQCVPKEFFRDDPLNPDCLDRTDEVQLPVYPQNCGRDPTFRCLEQTCRPGLGEIPCVNAKCVDGFYRCVDSRDDSQLDLDLLLATTCLMKKNTFFTAQSCDDYQALLPYISVRYPSYFEYPARSILFDHVRFIYSNNTILQNLTVIPLPEYVCYDEKLCGNIYPGEKLYNNLTCRYFNQFFQLNESKSFSNFDMFIETMKIPFLKCLPLVNQTHYCNHSTMYQCYNSQKCISKRRLVDGYFDCPFNDDETYNQSCSLNDINYRFRCLVNNMEKCFSPLIMRNYHQDCDTREDETFDNILGVYVNGIHFGSICNGYRDLLPTLINGKEVTDESECESRSCNHTYTQCDGYWYCKNGADELDCSPSDCPLFHHQCVFVNDTSKLSCLPISRAGDGIIDCIGGTDEFYQEIIHHKWLYPLNYFSCQNDTKHVPFTQVCNGIPDCPLADDENFCKSPDYDKGHILCVSGELRTKSQDFLCGLFQYIIGNILFSRFSLRNIPMYSIQTINDIKQPNITNIESTVIRKTDRCNIPKGEWCNHGIPIHVRNDENKSDIHCLCPPGYYGDKCEYQNERVSLTFQISFASDWENFYVFIVTLIDNERNIQSYDYIDYSPMIHCDMKFNIYLLYLNRQKNLSKTYSIQIDSLNKSSFNYRSSWIYPIKYPFLPSYRLSVLLKVPVSDFKIDNRCNPSCIHGQCYNYTNAPNSTYCRCYSGWSGIQCNNKLDCHCASDSYCLSNSICICSIDRYGRRCYLNYSSCQSNPCLNNGQCTTSDLRLRNSKTQMFRCICSFGYSGKRCEQIANQSRIEVTFDNEIEIPSTLLIHFLTSVKNSRSVRRVSLMKKIPIDKDILLFDVTFSFNMAFAQILNDYYLIILREKEILSANISTKISLSHRCLSIDQLLDMSIVNQHYLQRLKFYHRPCRERDELICFYDKNQICFCDLNRDANCFDFDHNKTYNCGENNYCQNEGQCFFNKKPCPTSSVCLCKGCYFGSQCRFSTRGSTLSLDIILGSHIRQNTMISEQTTIVKYSIAFSILIILFGLINSILIFLTFQMKDTRDVGCGLYLFVSSFTSLITICILTIKFWLLLLTQMGSIDNRSFIYIQCLSFDFLIRIFVSINDWLHSGVSLDRAFNIYKGVHFNKVKSKRIAKWTIFGVFILSICTYIHDPIYRYLGDDEEEKRTWCLTQYTFVLQIFDGLVNLTHILAPFLINFFSALLIIKSLTRRRSKIDKKKTYKQILIEQLRKHKHLLISTLILFILAIPRLIISFLSGCMKSPRNPWLHLIGYFISFIPSVLTLIVFVFPSKTYKEQLKKSVNRLCRQTN